MYITVKESPNTEGFLRVHWARRVYWQFLLKLSKLWSAIDVLHQRGPPALLRAYYRTILTWRPRSHKCRTMKSWKREMRLYLYLDLGFVPACPMPLQVLDSNLERGRIDSWLRISKHDPFGNRLLGWCHLSRNLQCFACFAQQNLVRDVSGHWRE